MNLLNATSMQAAWTMGIDPSGREHVVVVIKGTYLIPDDGAPVVKVAGAEGVVAGAG